MKTKADSRVLRELLETAEDLRKYGLATDEDLAKMKALQSSQGEPPDIPDAPGTPHELTK